jgi:prepilin-type N-terminal cleavage/methylation domain-containing protein
MSYHSEIIMLFCSARRLFVRAAKRRDAGVSLLELLIALSIIAALTATASIQLPPFIESMHKKNARQNLEHDIQRARSEALAIGGRAIITMASGGASYTLGIDRLPYSTSATPDSILMTREVPGAVSVALSTTLVFGPRGLLVDPSSGALTTLTYSISSHGTAYASGTVYATGYATHN